MSLEPDDTPELDENDELGQIEATEVPPAVDLTPDEEHNDPEYDRDLATLDPDEQGADLLLPEGEEQ